MPLPPGQPGQLDPTSNNLNPVPYDDSSALYSQSNAQDVVTDFKITYRYEQDYHRYMMGISSPGGFNNMTAAFVQLTAPTLLWIVDWTGLRALKRAMIPDPSVVNPGWLLLDASLEPYMVILAPNGTTPMYRLSGTYIYGRINTGPDFTSNLSKHVYPIAPWIIDQEGTNGQDGYIARVIDATDLQSFLLEPAQALAGPIG